MRVEELVSCSCTLPVPFFCCSLGASNILFNLDLLIHQLVFPNGLLFYRSSEIDEQLELGCTRLPHRH